MAVDLNMDMGDIVKGLLNKGGSTSAVAAPAAGSPMAKVKPFIPLVIFTIVLVGVIFAYVEFVYRPMQAVNNEKNKELLRLEDMKQKIPTLDARIKNLKNKLSESKEHFVEELSHFGNSEDLGELYQSISLLATKYDMVVLNIKEIATVKPPAKIVDGKEVKVNKNKTEVKEVRVDVELKGKYMDYINFKEELAVTEMLLKINSETVQVKSKADERGVVYVAMNLSTYAIDKEPFQNVISGGQNEK